MGAAAHLELFNRTVEAFDALSEEEAERLPRRRPGTPRPTASCRRASSAMEELDGEFEALLETEDITALNAAWLRGQEGLLVLDDEELAAHIAARVARVPDLEERQAEAEEEALENAPEFELIIRELCDIAGYALRRSPWATPTIEHNGETVLAWHFSTDHGDFLMVEDDDEAFMIHPETQEIVAAVEFEDADEGLVDARHL